MKNFTINDAYLCCVSVNRGWSIYDGRTELTDDELVKVLKGEDRCSSLSSDDHPEFAKLREQLGKEEFIRIERGWWNGDYVIKPFSLNGAKFKTSEQFFSGAAIKIAVDRKIKEQAKRLKVRVA
jgi:hypothetical protein